MKEQALLTLRARDRALASLNLVEASLRKVKPFSAATNYTPDELEPYDALCDRFVRCVEMALKFFRGYERLSEAIQSDTLRDLLLRMEKLGLVSTATLWVDMRDVRNRIVHDYLPEQVEALYALLQGPFAEELLALKDKLQTLVISDV